MPMERLVYLIVVAIIVIILLVFLLRVVGGTDGDGDVLGAAMIALPLRAQRRLLTAS